MNYVAHQLLSFHQPEIQIGNIYGEVIKGNQYKKYKGDILLGILLHREIDTFTDQHPCVKNSSAIFHERYAKYAPVIVDVVYDYILIQNWKKFSTQNFESFTDECYQLFSTHLNEFPEKARFIIEHLLKHDWFHNYSTIKGVQQTLRGISQRSKFDNQIYFAVEEIQANYHALENDFLEFFPQLVSHCKKFIQQHRTQISEFN